MKGGLAVGILKPKLYEKERSTLEHTFLSTNTSEWCPADRYGSQVWWCVRQINKKHNICTTFVQNECQRIPRFKQFCGQGRGCVWKNLPVYVPARSLGNTMWAIIALHPCKRSSAIYIVVCLRKQLLLPYRESLRQGLSGVCWNIIGDFEKCKKLWLRTEGRTTITKRDEGWNISKSLRDWSILPRSFGHLTKVQRNGKGSGLWWKWDHLGGI